MNVLNATQQPRFIRQILQKNKALEDAADQGILTAKDTNLLQNENLPRYKRLQQSDDHANMLIAGVVNQSLMSRNFTTAESEDSRYLQATKDSFSVEKNFSNKVVSLVASLSAELEAALTDNPKRLYIEACRVGRKVKRLLGHIINEEVNEAMAKQLEENRELIERESQKMLTPQVKEENSILSDSPPVPTEETAPMLLDLSSQNTSPPTTDLAIGTSQETTMPTQHLPANYSSVDITV